MPEGRAYAGCTQGAATNSKAAEPGRPTALHRTAWEGSSDLVSLSCVEKGRRPGPTRKAYAPKRLFCGGGLFVHKRLMLANLEISLFYDLGRKKPC